MMKRLSLIAFLFFSVGILSTNAQEIGFRWGDVTGGDFAVDGVFGVGEFSRIHANASFGGNDGIDFGIDAIYDFIYRPIDGEALNWYAGVGPFLGFGDYFALGATGEVGIEYRFSIPLSLSADWRPAFRLIEDTDFDIGGFGVNLRYIIGKD